MQMKIKSHMWIAAQTGMRESTLVCRRTWHSVVPTHAPVSVGLSPPQQSHRVVGALVALQCCDVRRECAVLSSCRRRVVSMTISSRRRVSSNAGCDVTRRRWRHECCSWRKSYVPLCCWPTSVTLPRTTVTSLMTSSSALAAAQGASLGFR